MARNPTAAVINSAGEFIISLSESEQSDREETDTHNSFSGKERIKYQKVLDTRGTPSGIDLVYIQQTT